MQYRHNKGARSSSFCGICSEICQSEIACEERAYTDMSKFNYMHYFSYDIYLHAAEEYDCFYRNDKYSCACIYNESTSSHNDGSGVSIGLPSENNNVSSFIPNESSDIGSVNPNLNETEICYWTKSGEVYHLYSDCQHIKNSSIVFSGPVSESGKERVCRTCYSRYIMEEYNTDGLN
mgnify:CR=1 FL=1